MTQEEYRSRYTKEYQDAVMLELRNASKDKEKIITVNDVDWTIEYARDYRCDKFSERYIEEMLSNGKKTVIADIPTNNDRESEARRLINNLNKAVRDLQQFNLR